MADTQVKAGSSNASPRPPSGPPHLQADDAHDDPYVVDEELIESEEAAPPASGEENIPAQKAGGKATKGHKKKAGGKGDARSGANVQEVKPSGAAAAEPPSSSVSVPVYEETEFAAGEWLEFAEEDDSDPGANQAGQRTQDVSSPSSVEDELAERQNTQKVNPKPGAKAKRGRGDAKETAAAAGGRAASVRRDATQEASETDEGEGEPLDESDVVALDDGLDEPTQVSLRADLGFSAVRNMAGGNLLVAAATEAVAAATGNAEAGLLTRLDVEPAVTGAGASGAFAAVSAAVLAHTERGLRGELLGAAPRSVADHLRRAVSEGKSVPRPVLWRLRAMLLRQGEARQALEVLYKELSYPGLTPPERAALLVEKGRLLESKLSDPAEAKRAYEAALGHEPKFIPALILLERRCTAERDLAGRITALSSLVEAVAEVPTKVALLCELSSLENSPTAKIDRLDQALELVKAEAKESEPSAGGSGADAKRAIGVDAVLELRARVAESAGMYDVEVDTLEKKIERLGVPTKGTSTAIAVENADLRAALRRQQALAAAASGATGAPFATMPAVPSSAEGGRTGDGDGAGKQRVAERVWKFLRQAAEAMPGSLLLLREAIAAGARAGAHEQALELIDRYTERLFGKSGVHVSGVHVRPHAEKEADRGSERAKESERQAVALAIYRSRLLEHSGAALPVAAIAGAPSPADTGSETAPPATGDEALERLIAQSPHLFLAYAARERQLLSQGKGAELAALWELEAQRAAEGRLGLAADLEWAASMMVQASVLHEWFLGNLEAAVAACRQAVTYLDAYPPALVALERLYSKLGRHADLAALLERQHVGSNVSAERADYVNEALVRLYRGPLRGPHRALTALRRLIERQPKDVRMRRRLIQAYVEAEQWSEVLAEQRKLATMVDGGQRISVLVDALDVAVERLGDEGAAEALGRELLTAQPDHPMALAVLEALLVDQSRPDEARQLLEQAIEQTHDADRKVAMLYRLAELAERQLSKPELASSAYRAILEIRPRDVSALCLLVRALSVAEHDVGVAECMAKEVELLSPGRSRAEGYLRLAEVYEDRLGQDLRAEEAYLRAVGEDPTFVDAYFGLLRVQARRRDWSSLAQTYVELSEMPGIDTPSKILYGNEAAWVLGRNGVGEDVHAKMVRYLMSIRTGEEVEASTLALAKEATDQDFRASVLLLGGLRAWGLGQPLGHFIEAAEALAISPAQKRLWRTLLLEEREKSGVSAFASAAGRPEKVLAETGALAVGDPKGEAEGADVDLAGAEGPDALIEADRYERQGKLQAAAVAYLACLHTNADPSQAGRFPAGEHASEYASEYSGKAGPTGDADTAVKLAALAGLRRLFHTDSSGGEASKESLWRVCAHLGALLADPEASGNAYLEAAAVLDRQLGRPEEAVAYYRQALERLVKAPDAEETSQPDDIYERLHQILVERRDFASLEEVLTFRLTHVTSVDGRVALFAERADLRLMLGHRKGAARDLHALLALEPDHLDSARKLGDIYAAEAMNERAAFYYERFLADAEGLPGLRHGAHMRLADLYGGPLRDTRSMIRHLRHAASLLPSDGVAYERLAAAYLRLRDYPRAIDAERRAAQAKGDVASLSRAEVRVGQIYRDALGDRPSARRAFERACAWNPMSAEAIAELGAFLHQEGDEGSRRVLLQKSLVSLRGSLASHPLQAQVAATLSKVADWVGAAPARYQAVELALLLGSATPADAEFFATRRAERPVMPARTLSQEGRERLVAEGLAGPWLELWEHVSAAVHNIMGHDAQRRGASRSSKVTLRGKIEWAYVYRVAEALGFPLQDIYVDGGPTTVVPVGAAPGTLIIGRAFQNTPAPEERYRLGRAITYLCLRAAVLSAMPSQEALAWLLAAAKVTGVNLGDTGSQSTGAGGTLDERAKRIERGLSRAERRQLGLLAPRLSSAIATGSGQGGGGFAGANSFLAALGTTATRVGLLFAGDLAAALSVACGWRGPGEGRQSPLPEELELLQGHAEAMAILRFQASDDLLALRRELGWV